MEPLQSLRKPPRERGFTVIETMVATIVLAVGLLSVAALISQMSQGSNKSRYMSSAAMLASEKLEDLNHYPAGAAQIAAGGSLAGTPAGYYDTIEISSEDGAVSESITSGGVTTIMTHNADGTVTTTAPPVTKDLITFQRNWVIEQDQPVVGVRRITVLVTMVTQAGGQNIQFQTSMVRP